DGEPGPGHIDEAAGHLSRERLYLAHGGWLCQGRPSFAPSVGPEAIDGQRFHVLGRRRPISGSCRGILVAISQYPSAHYQALLARHGIVCSMSRKADCWDNAPVESFFASLKKELVHGPDCAMRAARGRRSASTSRCST